METFNDMFMGMVSDRGYSYKLARICQMIPFVAAIKGFGASTLGLHLHSWCRVSSVRSIDR